MIRFSNNNLAVPRSIRLDGAVVNRLATAIASVFAIAPQASISDAVLATARAAQAGDGSEGFVIDGAAGHNESGTSVSAAGDVNGDGVNDLIVSSPRASSPDRTYNGQSYVLFGRTTGFPATISLASLLPPGGDGSAGFAMTGISERDFSGNSVSDAGDVNGDGAADVIVGSQASPHGRNAAGQSYVVFGRTTGFPAVIPLASLLPSRGGDGSSGFALNGIAPIDVSGYSVSSTGDVNGDDIDDLIIGAPFASRNQQNYVGESYVVFGRSTGFPAAFELRNLLSPGNGSEGFVLRGARNYDLSGHSVSGAGDVNGDGIADLVVGAPGVRVDDRLYVGASFVVFGRTGGFSPILPLGSLLPVAGGDGTKGFVLIGAAADDKTADAVSAAGDINGDGIDDLVIGAHYADPNNRSRAGVIYVVFGSTTGFPASVPLRSLWPAGGGDGSMGFVLKGVTGYDVAGSAVSGAGDVNGDGIDDLLIGARFAGPSDESEFGAGYVLFGRTTGFPATLELASLTSAGGGDGSEGFVLRGFPDYETVGWSVSAAGDVNGDGTGDLLLGAPFSTPDGHGFAGVTFVVFGRTTGFPALFELSSLLPP